jgi:sortase A
MKPREWAATCLEWALLGFGAGCLATYAYVSVEAHRFQQARAAQFQRIAAIAGSTAIAPGALIGMLDVPRLGLSTPVIEGDDDETLERSVGHLPDTPMPWDRGNSAVAGHRDGLFRPLKNIKVGDEIRFRTPGRDLLYEVTRTSVVEPRDLWVLDPASGADLTLITCYPFYWVGSAPERFVVHARRVVRPAKP